MIRTLGSALLMVFAVFFALAWLVSASGSPVFLLTAVVFLIASFFVYFAFRGGNE